MCRRQLAIFGNLKDACAVTYQIAMIRIDRVKFISKNLQKHDLDSKRLQSWWYSTLYQTVSIVAYPNQRSWIIAIIEVTNRWRCRHLINEALRTEVTDFATWMLHSVLNGTFHPKRNNVCWSSKHKPNAFSWLLYFWIFTFSFNWNILQLADHYYVSATYE